MIKRILVLVSLLFYIFSTFNLSSFAQSSTATNKKSGFHFHHIPILYAPIGFIEGAHWGTKAFADALGDKEGVLENTVGFIIGAPIGAVAGTAAGLIGGPFTD